LYKYNPKSGEWDLNSGGKKQLKDIMKKVIDEYLEVEAIGQYQEKAKEQIIKVKEKFPKISESKLDKILEMYI
jgi:Na+/phosphate symporter